MRQYEYRGYTFTLKKGRLFWGSEGLAEAHVPTGRRRWGGTEFRCCGLGEARIGLERMERRAMKHIDRDINKEAINDALRDKQIDMRAADHLGLTA